MGQALFGGHHMWILFMIRSFPMALHVHYEVVI
jgi:hypothetical protein